MKVRCWVIVGDESAGRTLPPMKDLGQGRMNLGGPLPNAAEREVGDWLVWAPAVGQPPMTLICVEIPLFHCDRR